MLETRTPLLSTLPRPAARAPSRSAAERAVLLPAPSPPVRRPERVPAPMRAVAARAGRTRQARSEARLLTVAVVATALMCATLVIYLAAYARVSQLGVDQAAAQRQLRLARLDNDRLQAQLASLQSPARVAAAAQALGMTAGGRRVTYLLPDSSSGAAPGGARSVQVANSGTAADGTATDGH